jgi:hypothetical protein
MLPTKKTLINKSSNEMNQPRRSQHPLLLEALEYQDLEGMVKPTIHVDEFASKMGDDDDIMVLSFFVRDRLAARDLMSWFEQGYDWVLDSDVSPGEISPGRYLVYVELRRRSAAARQVAEMLDDLNTLTEFKVNDWTIHSGDRSMPFSEDNLATLVPMSPKQYRQQKEQDLNEMRTAAGLDTKAIYDRDRDIRALQSAAGI